MINLISLSPIGAKHLIGGGGDDLLGPQTTCQAGKVRDALVCRVLVSYGLPATRTSGNRPYALA
jgi:hypothetical protein